MTSLNSIAAGFSANEALVFMADKAGVSVETIALHIMNDKQGEVAQYFAKLLKAGYSVAIEVTI